jgi:deazaflavin-dependent oxidoreductase (nitroreductase family)
VSGNLGNIFMKAILNSPLHPLLGSGFAVITVAGRKTGKSISTPINVVKDGDGLTVVSLRARTWWRNLRGGKPATLRLAGRQLSVRGEVLEAQSDVVEAFAHFFQRFPNYAKYYGVRPAADGSVTREALERLADKHVIIHLAEVGRV